MFTYKTYTCPLVYVVYMYKVSGTMFYKCSGLHLIHRGDGNGLRQHLPDLVFVTCGIVLKNGVP